MIFRKLIKSLGGSSKPKAPRGKDGARVYAVGDVHGCLELLDDMLVRVEADVKDHPVSHAFLVFVGDLIDRGPDSAGVIERLRTYNHPDLKLIFLAGNHEEFFLRVLGGERGVLYYWLDYGGRECVESYGVNAEELMALPEGEAAALLRQHVPESHRLFLESFGDSFRFGDYVIVHAGIRPGLPLDQQSRADLRWIRDPFLGDSADHGFVVVHGHTIVDQVEERTNRIAIDTGAYRTGVLTGLILEGAERRLLSVERTPVWYKAGRAVKRSSQFSAPGRRVATL